MEPQCQYKLLKEEDENLEEEGGDGRLEEEDEGEKLEEEEAELEQP